jgi:uncharacterized protein YbjT (DUF2867 family)
MSTQLPATSCFARGRRNEAHVESGHLRAKVAQENLIMVSSNPHSIIRVTTFYEFINDIADFSKDGNRVHFPPLHF